MKQQDAIELLKMKSAISNPSELSDAIDIVLKMIDESYTKEEYLTAAELGEVSYHDAKHVVSMLDEAREYNKKNQYKI
jgi:hypothetical protein